MRIYATVCVTVLALVAGSCTDAPTEPRPHGPSPEQAPLMKRSPGGSARADALSNMPVTGTLYEPFGSTPHDAVRHGSVAGAFAGTFTVTRFDIDPVTRQLYVSGILTSGGWEQPVAVTRVPATLAGHGPATKAAVRPAQASCDILFLDLGPIHLDLLGLVLDVSRITIDLDAQTGGGNLLGNLLCGLLGLLDIPGLLGAVSNLLDLVNTLLSNLGGGAGTPTA